MPIVAIHYRRSDEEKNTAAGHWSEHTSVEAARDWLNRRTKKTDTSPKGTIIFENREQLNTVLQFGFDKQPVSLQKAISNYMKWKKY